MATEMERQKLGTCVIIINSQNEVLLGKRLCQLFYGYYGLPGGSLEPGESPITGGQREALEETTLQVENPFLLAAVI
jgi:ADP-ribose pyrophosphatase YjhB (NUDIX family)